MINLFQLPRSTFRSNDAGSKAPNDVYRILQSLGAKDLSCLRPLSQRCLTNLLLQVWWFLVLLKFLLILPFNLILVLQLPGGLNGGRPWVFFLRLIRKLKKARLVFLVHDVDELRCGSGVDYAIQRWNDYDSLCDYFIIHNQRMRQWFVSEKGISEKKLLSLELFDYLMDGDSLENEPRYSMTVTIAGNLMFSKSGYLRWLPKIPEVRWELFGPNYVDGTVNRIHYNGSYAPDDLICHLGHGWGLVWDGDGIDGCTGPRGRYLRYNNPHKMSLYLACGMPVIIWSQSALSDFVTRNGIGIAVNSLVEIPERILAIAPHDFSTMCLRVKEIAVKLRRGDFLSSVVRKIV